MRVHTSQLMYVPNVGDIRLIKNGQQNKYCAAEICEMIHAPSNGVSKTVKLKIRWLDNPNVVQLKEVKSLLSILPIGPDDEITKRLKFDGKSYSLALR